MVHPHPGASGARRLRDRAEAGRELGQLLTHYRGDPNVIVLGLPRGGVPVAAQVARLIGAPLDVFVVRDHDPGHDVEREAHLRGEQPPLEVHGKTVIVVDDGLATGVTMHAAARAIRGLHPARIVVAVPVAANDTCASFSDDVNVDAMVCARVPQPFRAVGLWYEHFEQTSDAEVQDALASAR